MLYREIMAVCSEIHTQHRNTLCGQNVGLLNVTVDDTYNLHSVMSVRLPLCLINAHSMNTTGGVEVQCHVFVTSTLDR